MEQDQQDIVTFITTTPTEPREQIIENAIRDDGHPGDHMVWEVTETAHGVTRIDRREGTAHHRTSSGDWVTAEGGWLTEGEFEGTALTIRRTIEELPTKPGTVIVPADGHEFIEAVFNGVVYHAREAVRTSGGLWLGAWRATDRTESYLAPGHITPGTWKVEGE